MYLVHPPQRLYVHFTTFHRAKVAIKTFSTNFFKKKDANNTI